MSTLARPAPAARVRSDSGWLPYCETCRVKVRHAVASCPDCGERLGIASYPSEFNQHAAAPTHRERVRWLGIGFGFGMGLAAIVVSIMALVTR